MDFSKLKEETCKGNLELVKHGLVKLTWGNLSVVDASGDYFAIKPSGVAYDALTPDDIVILDFEGNTIEGNYRPSSDTPTHLLLLKAWKDMGVHSMVHTHSTMATAFAQAGAKIPCFGTTHADHFNGPTPLTRILTEEEVNTAYEENTGKVILETFNDGGLNPLEFPGVLVRGHAPFTWGKTPAAAVANSVALEEIANMALATMSINENANPLPPYVLRKHFERKHGKNAYYGQK